MALQSLPGQGIAVTPVSLFPLGPLPTSTSTINAVGETIAFIGPLYLSSGPTTSKVVSSAGGRIWFQLSTTVWAAAGTTLRVGIQDVDATTGLEDGTFDVFDDLVQGTDPLASGVRDATMSSGTKTIANGDIVAVVIEMTVRNGADSVNPIRGTMVSAIPYTTADSGAGPAKQSVGVPWCTVLFDDGTIGSFGDWTMVSTESNISYGDASTPDEYGMFFTLPFTCSIATLLGKIAELDTGETGNISLYEDPVGGGAAVRSVAIDPDIAFTVTSPDAYVGVAIAEYTLLAGVEYCISYVPSSAALRSIRMVTFPDASHLAGLGVAVLGATRTGGGAWTTSTTAIPDFGFRISQLDDGAGGGGGATSAAYLG